MAENNRVALVTGGAKRVGRAIVLQLAKAGYDIAITYRTSENAANSLVDELRHAGRRALAIEADLTQVESSVELIHREVRQYFGRLDVLVNSASIYKAATLAQTDIQLLRQLDAIHVHAPLLLCQGFSAMLRENRGHVINMVDLLAARPWPDYMAYCASKAGLWSLTMSLARELAPEVTVNGIAPGVVQWPDDMPLLQREQYLKRVALARTGTPQDVAELVEFLITRGTYITGQIIRLDGGRSLF
ncbi:MAG: SDR family oxidoreductase [Phycisphaerales bacterium]|nr:SDR family oxidoreductase [Phycisphaerales bacterium]